MTKINLSKKVIVFGLLLLMLGSTIGTTVNGTEHSNVDNKTLSIKTIEYEIINSPPIPPVDTSKSIVEPTRDSVILSDVPTSTWTYGCTATAAGMIFGYYDRTGYDNMYTGPTNNGVCPLTDLGQGIGTPIPGSCYIIATQQGHDGITSKAHVDDYWISYGNPGPDPWEGNWAEHEWDLCIADFIGTNQWKWDYSSWPYVDGEIDNNIDGSTIYFSNNGGTRLYDFIPPADHGIPQTACCHGMRLFAESRGYSVDTNYNQQTDNQNANGFSFVDFKNEIDSGYPVMIHVTGHSMVGVGYDDSTGKIYIHDTWDNNVHEMNWGGNYAGMELKGVTVIHLGLPPPPPPKEVLVVHDDLGEYINVISEALLANSYTLNIWDINSQESMPPLEYMLDHEVVFWYCHDSYSLSLDAQNCIAEYLDNWGKLFISGSRFALNSCSSDWERMYLHRGGGGHTVKNSIDGIFGQSGSPFFGLNFNLNGNPSDELTCIDPADLDTDGAFGYRHPYGGGLFAGIMAETFRVSANTAHRVVYLGYSFENIIGEQNRIDVMDEAMDFLMEPFSPIVFITSGPDGIIQHDDVTFEWTGFDDQNNAYDLEYKYRLFRNGIPDDWIIVSPGASRTAAYSNLEWNMDYVFEVKANDGEGWGESATRSFSIGDTEPPVVTITSGPEGLIHLRDVGFLWHASESGCQFQYRLIKPGPDDEWSDWSTTTHTTYNNLEDGQYRFDARANDGINTGETTSRYFQVNYEPNHGPMGKELCQQAPWPPWPPEGP